MAEIFPVAIRAPIGDVAADEDLIEVVGDTATVPGEALSRTDLPSGDPTPSFPDLRSTRQHGRWYLLP
jgi:hypothetical protein